jgi:hypothetical protein
MDPYIAACAWVAAGSAGPRAEDVVIGSGMFAVGIYALSSYATPITCSDPTTESWLLQFIEARMLLMTPIEFARDLPCAVHHVLVAGVCRYALATGRMASYILAGLAFEITTPFVCLHLAYKREGWRRDALYGANLACLVASFAYLRLGLGSAVLARHFVDATCTVVDQVVCRGVLGAIMVMNAVWARSLARTVGKYLGAR